ncbi:MAG: hypothetical protein AAF560_03715 [Acidobacteriota bacterium]
MPFLKSIHGRLKSCDSVIQSIQEHGQRVSGILSDRLSGLIEEGGEMPDLWALQQLFLKQLQASSTRLEQAEKAHIAELGNDAKPRAERDAATKELSEVVLDLRQMFEGLYRPENIESFGFPDRVSREPALLLRQADHLIEQIADPERPLPEARRVDIELTPESILRNLEPSTQTLREALDTVGREAKRAAPTLADRNRAQSDYDQAFLWTARTLEAMYSLAGETELAAVVRPSRRRPGRTAKHASEERETASNPEATEPSEPADGTVCLQHSESDPFQQSVVDPPQPV